MSGSEEVQDIISRGSEGNTLESPNESFDHGAEPIPLKYDGHEVRRHGRSTAALCVLSIDGESRSADCRRTILLGSDSTR
jgi:hypothetical protein